MSGYFVNLDLDLDNLSWQRIALVLPRSEIDFGFVRDTLHYTTDHKTEMFGIVVWGHLLPRDKTCYRGPYLVLAAFCRLIKGPKDPVHMGFHLCQHPMRKEVHVRHLDYSNYHNLL